MSVPPNSPMGSPKSKRPPGIELTFGELGETPQVHPGRTLILCFDGVAVGDYGERNTNVIHLLSCLQKSHPKQLIYYQAIIGTSSAPQQYTLGSFGKRASNFIDHAVASCTEDRVYEGYRFLQSAWKEGDKICVFGFSRGAHVARALAGMLHTAGLLPPWEHVKSADELYKDVNRDAPRSKYKRDACRAIKIDFLGLWDTVLSAGNLVSRTLPFSQSTSSAIVFRHAMALDERRASFIPLPWRLSSIVTARGNEGSEHHASNTNAAVSWIIGFRALIINILFSLFIKPFVTYRFGYNNNWPLVPEEESPSDVEEVWFAGGEGAELDHLM
ncbi:uncharacterized protein EI90DRAFT_3077015 [Cantharellus anzutake]|uniref:uncharacterized protein n=1 Tax=Cantharellus anzutake TaxID=1750568 RepID=UPI001903DB3E|nr:uncharacterized protein EI90DRAFT_3077015 [Cantharellus anzutake]KAF8322970.1 hypothetical protein EI90DRAFT_3077015 [Cantharellus anzutake]